MCLSEVWTDEQMNEWLEGQGEVIEAWKGVLPRKKGYCIRDFTPLIATPYKAGLNEAHQKKVEANDKKTYWSGFHFFASIDAAKQYWHDGEELICAPLEKGSPNIKIVKCLIKKEWITATGMGMFGWITIVASQAVFPHYPETEARIEDMPKEEPIKETSKCISQN